MLASLINTGREDPVVLAILLTESFFRTRLDRALELAVWIVLSVLSPCRARFVSVGIAQIQVRHWQIPTGFWIVRMLRQIMVFSDPTANYDNCLSLLQGFRVSEPSDLRLLRYYTGQVTRYHMMTYREFYRRCVMLRALRDDS